MEQQTLPRPSRHVPEHSSAARHRKPRAPRTGGSISAQWRRTAGVLLVLFALSWLAGVLLAAHGPTGSSSPAARPAVTLAPQGPTVPEPVHVEPTQPVPEPSQVEPTRPAPKPAHPAEAAASGTGAAKRVEARKVVLRPGDTLYALAGRHGTTVKALQRLNALGASTLIYAGDTFRVPAGTGPVGETREDRPTDGAPSASAKSVAKSPARSAPRRVVAFAQAQLGKPYIWGGTGPRGYDCSGLVTRAWKAAGVSLPRTTWGLVRAGTATTRAQLVPGDLVIANGGGHVQLYIGHGKVIHAPRPGSTVTVAPLAAASDVVSYRHITP